MMRILLLVGFCVHLSLAQETEFDSLSSALKNAPDDTTRLTILTDLAYKHFPYNDPVQGMKTAEEAIALARRLALPTKLAYAYRSKGINHWARSEYVAALEMYTRALEEYEGANATVGIADTYNNLGVVYYSLSNYKKALDFYLKALPLYEQSGDRKLANILTNIGIIHKNLSDPAKALEYYTRALQLYEAGGNSRGMANALANIGNAYDDLDSTAQALAFHRRALTINQAIGSMKGVANSLNSIGILYSQAAENTQALEFLQESLRLYEQLGEKNSMAVALMELSKLYRNAPAGFLIERGIQPSMRYASALAFTKRALQLATEIGALDRQRFAWEELSTIYEAQREYPKALEAFKKGVAFRDSIMNNESKSEIAVRTMQFEFEKKEALLRADHQKEQELAFEKLKQQRIQNNSVTGGAALLLIGGVTTFLLYKKRADAEQRRKEAELRALVTDTEMKALRAQMNPHFIFNSLNSISDYIAKHDTATADYYLTKFAGLMRLILENSEKREVSLTDDLKALELYMQLEAMRLNKKFVYDISVDESLDRENTLLPPLLLQPFVENSIWHGLANKQGEGKILVQILKENGMILCTVEDNGVGRKMSGQILSDRTKHSFGIKITKARIDILNQIKHANATVELFDLAEGTRVEVKLPLQPRFEEVG
jgi:tetratricopeptide (TPR) repeat protein